MKSIDEVDWHNKRSAKSFKFLKQKKCYICDTDCKQLVRDHDHLNGKYRGSACNVCNLNFHHIKKDKNTLKLQKPCLPIQACVEKGR